MDMRDRQIDPLNTWPWVGCACARAIMMFLMTFCAVPCFASGEPEIEHQEIDQGTLKEDIAINARLTDPDGIFDPAVLFRVKGASRYQRLPMAELAENEFQAIIPGRLVTDSLEYYIEVYDQEGNGPARFGEEDFPIEIRVSMPSPNTGDAAETTGDITNGSNDEQDADPNRPNQPETGEQSSESEASSIGLYAGVGIGAGVLALGAAVIVTSAVVVAVLFWPSSPPAESDSVTIEVNGPVPVEGLVNRGHQ